jgi:K+-transporting ATPase ATPase A chain
VTWPNLGQYALFLALVIICVKPVGLYLLRVFDRDKTLLDPLLLPIERLFYRAAGIDPQSEMNWKEYAFAFAIFGVFGTVLLSALLLFQRSLPWFDAANQTTPMTFDLALNAAISFATTTTWQAYGGETTMSYFSQMVGLAAQNFMAGAAGLAVGVAFIRGLAREKTAGLGNFWVDLTRAMLWVLLPLSVAGGVFLIWQGVPMNFSPYTNVSRLQGAAQTIAQGPVAAMETIKNLGTNGGGFFNVNGAHPYENPTSLTNVVEMLMIVVLPASLTYTFGRMVGRTRQGWMILGVMTFLFVAGLILGAWAEQSGNPRIAALGVDTQASDLQPGGNMEGKDVRFGIHGSVLAAVATSNGATGSNNSMHDSYTPVGGMVPLVNMLLGEIAYGGLGTGLYSMVMVVLVSVFVGGLMVGRTPTFLGKQVRQEETRLVAFYMVLGAAAVLVLTSLAIMTEWGRAGLTVNSGAHGFTEILFAYSSSFANNGQSFAGLSANTVFYNLSTAIAMLAGRFGLAALALALAGSFVQQPRKPDTSGSLETDTPTFAIFVTATAIILVGLSYLPALALGPIIEHLMMMG